MRGRRRSPGDSSGPVGMGAARSDYRHFRSGGGFRRGGQPKPSSYDVLPPPPPPPPPSRHRANVLLEAGRLAAEYLVAKGLLPASSLPPSTAARWRPSGGGGEVGRTSALARLGRRRLDDDDRGLEPRKRSRRRRHRSGSYNRQGLEWGRENGRGRSYSDAMDDDDSYRSGRWSGRVKGFADAMDDEDSDRQGRSEDSGCGDVSIGGREPLKVATADELLLPSKSEVKGGSELEQEKHSLADDTVSKNIDDSETQRDGVPEAELILKTRSDDIVVVLDLEMEDVEKAKGSVETDRRNGLQLEEEEAEKAKGSFEADRQNGLELEEEEEEALAVSSFSAVEEEQESLQGVSLLSGSAKVSMKPRTSVTNRNIKTARRPGAVDVSDNSDVFPKEGGLEDKAEISTLSLSNNAPTDQPQSSRDLVSDISILNTSTDSLTKQPQSPRDGVPKVSRSQSVQFVESVEQCFTLDTESKRCSRSHSFPGSSFAHMRQETNEGPPEFELPRKSNDASIRESHAENMSKEGMKQPRQWSPSSLSDMDEYFYRSRPKQLDMPVEKLSVDHETVDTTGQDHADVPLKAVVQSVNKFEEQRQLPSSSFKILDLNLMEAPEITDISNDPVLENVPASTISLESQNNTSVGLGFSICQRQNEVDSNIHRSSDNKVVPVIDLEDDYPVEGNACGTSGTRTEPVYPNLENFLNNPGNPVGLPNIQDGYGLAMSEFLGNDITGCPAVQGGVNSLQAFHGPEGITGNDDSLYVSLGEIPLNFMEVWDQPAPEYEKFF